MENMEKPMDDINYKEYLKAEQLLNLVESTENKMENNPDDVSIDEFYISFMITIMNEETRILSSNESLLRKLFFIFIAESRKKRLLKKMSKNITGIENKNFLDYMKQFVYGD